MKKLGAKDLEKGKEYWLDEFMDESGIFETTIEGYSYFKPVIRTWYSKGNEYKELGLEGKFLRFSDASGGDYYEKLN